MARNPITPIRFTPDDLADLDALVQLCGCSRPDAIRQAVRWYRGFMQAQYDRHILCVACDWLAVHTGETVPEAAYSEESIVEAIQRLDVSRLRRI